MTANQSTSASSAAAAAQAMALAPGTRLSEYEVRSVLGSGGFGIVYLAWDHGLQREVAIKEYMPATLAGRGPDMAVSVRSDATATTFALGLKSFVNEARLLAQFNHPSLVKVHRFWEANNTAYMVMPYYRGRTLRHVRASMSEAPGDVACRHVLRALMSALDVLHREEVFHRDIAPDNILLCDDSTPVLLDFGAARKVIGEGNQALTSILKPHYAPLEQYADQRSMRQGPWTDLYALGATLYYFVTGEEPIAAASRALHDDQPRLAEQPVGDLSRQIAELIDWMLALKPAHRPQSVQALRDVLEGHAAVPSPVTGTVAAPHTTVAQARPIKTDIDPTEPPPAPTAAPSPPSATMVITGNPATQAAASQAPTRPPPVPVGQDPAVLSPTVINTASNPEHPMATPPKRTGVTGGHGALLLGLLCINVLAWWWFTRPAAPAAPTTAAAVAVSEAASPTAASAASAPMVTPPTTADAASAAQVSSEPKETIVSVMPGRTNPPTTEPAHVGKIIKAEPSTPALGAAAALPADTSPRVEPSAPSARGRAAAEPLASVKPADPRERCGDRNFISMSMCIKRECDKDASLRSHPECVKMREIEEAQRNPSF